MKGTVRLGPNGSRRREVVVDFVNLGVLSSERLLLLPCPLDSLLLRRGDEKELPLVPLLMESCHIN